MLLFAFKRTLLVFAALSMIACGRSVPLRATTPVLLQQQSGPQVLRAAIVRALQARRYTMESEQPGMLVASYQRRGQTLRVQLDYDASNYRITYLDSTGLGYRARPDGTATISRSYDRYVAQLQRTISSEIDRPEREAREAVQAEQNRQREAREHTEQLAREARESTERREREARDFEARERQRDRLAQLEAQRLRTEQARAEADAARPRIVDHEAYVVDTMVARRGRRVRSRFGAVRLSARRRARWVDGQAEGDASSRSLGLPASCRGYYAGTPEHVLQVGRRTDYVRLETDSEGDPTLMLVAADGSVYCDDDGGAGLNSRIEGSFPPGTYRVYVGTYQPGTSVRYRLLITAERARERVVEPVVRREPVAPRGPVDCRALLVRLGHSPAQGMHCRGAEPYCAAALLRAGHSPAQLLHCQGVEPQCAVNSLRAGRSPAQLLHCR